MPMIVFECNNPNCDNKIKKLYTQGTKIPPFLDCGACSSGKLERQLCAPGMNSTQVIDNGLQQRQVVVSKDVVEKEKEKL